MGAKKVEVDDGDRRYGSHRFNPSKRHQADESVTSSDRFTNPKHIQHLDWDLLLNSSVADDVAPPGIDYGSGWDYLKNPRLQVPVPYSSYSDQFPAPTEALAYEAHRLHQHVADQNIHPSRRQLLSPSSQEEQQVSERNGNSFSIKIEQPSPTISYEAGLRQRRGRDHPLSRLERLPRDVLLQILLHLPFSDILSLFSVSSYLDFTIPGGLYHFSVDPKRASEIPQDNTRPVKSATRVRARLLRRQLFPKKRYRVYDQDTSMTDTHTPSSSSYASGSRSSRATTSEVKAHLHSVLNARSEAFTKHLYEHIMEHELTDPAFGTYFPFSYDGKEWFEFGANLEGEIFACEGVNRRLFELWVRRLKELEENIENIVSLVVDWWLSHEVVHRDLESRYIQHIGLWKQERVTQCIRIYLIQYAQRHILGTDLKYTRDGFEYIDRMSFPSPRLPLPAFHPSTSSNERSVAKQILKHGITERIWPHHTSFQDYDLLGFSNSQAQAAMSLQIEFVRYAHPSLIYKMMSLRAPATNWMYPPAMKGVTEDRAARRPKDALAEAYKHITDLFERFFFELYRFAEEREKLWGFFDDTEEGEMIWASLKDFRGADYNKTENIGRVVEECERGWRGGKLRLQSVRDHVADKGVHLRRGRTTEWVASGGRGGGAVAAVAGEDYGDDEDDGGVRVKVEDEDIEILEASDGTDESLDEVMGVE